MERSVLPEIVDGSSSVRLRRWLVGDAEALQQLVLGSIDHLRPWMPWVAEEPLTLEQRRAKIVDWENDWRRGGDVVMGIFSDGAAAGSCGLHRRIGPGGVEIGYWIHPAFLRRGLATEAARLLTGAAFSLPRIDRVEIRHDTANHASAGIPRKLGYRLIGTSRDAVPDPAGVGIAHHWRMTRPEWTDSQRR